MTYSRSLWLRLLHTCLSLKAVHRTVLTLGLVTSAIAGPALAQNGNGGQQGASNPFVGSWASVFPQPSGGTNYTFERYGADGTYLLTNILRGSSTDGFRVQFWGRYTIQQVKGNSYRVTRHYTGHAPLQICAQGGGCNPFPPPADENLVFTFLDGRHLTAGGTNPVLERVAQIPQQLMAQLPQSEFVAVPAPAVSVNPSLSTGGSSSSGGYQSGSIGHVPGQGGTCDNLQQQRICTINDGYMYTGRDGCQHCSK